MVMTQNIKRQWGFVLAICLSLLAYGGMVQMQWRFGTLRDAHVPETIGWYGIAFAAFILAIIWVEKQGVSMRWVWGTAVTFRLLLLFTIPTLSDDVYRYLWDGYVANQGVSPYAHAINSPELDSLDIPQRAQANNAWMASPYLPAAQLVFWGVTAVFPLHPLSLQITMLLFDLACALLISRLLTHAKLPPHRLLLYLWNPLIILETTHSAHLDPWMILLTLLAITFTIHNSQFTIHNSPRSFLSPTCLALATLTKPLPLLLTPILFWRWTWPQRILYALLTIGLLVPFGVQAGWGLSGDLDGTGLFGALRIYTNQWNFNSGLFHWLEQFLGKQGAADPTNVAKLIIGVVMMGVLTAVFLRARTITNLTAMLRLTAVPFIAYVLLTPTLHPWYILILLTFLPFLPPTPSESGRRWWTAVPWLYLSFALIFSFLTYLDPLNFGELEWVRQLEWLPTLGLWGMDIFLNRRRKIVSRQHNCG